MKRQNKLATLIGVSLLIATLLLTCSSAQAQPQHYKHEFEDKIVYLTFIREGLIVTELTPNKECVGRVPAPVEYDGNKLLRDDGSVWTLEEIPGGILVEFENGWHVTYMKTDVNPIVFCKKNKGT